MSRLILFDIDGTLIDSGGTGKRALNRAFEEAFRIADAIDGVSCAGKTDAGIIREMFAGAGLTWSKEKAAEFLAIYPRRLREAMSESSASVKPGVNALLELLAQRLDWHVGLLTGNVREGARIKLEPFGLNDFFPFGAFGDNHAERDDLLPIAVEMLKRHAGVYARYEECVIIGDTPLDIACALAHGARSIGVATGPYTEEVLRKAGAHLTLPDLTDAAGVIRWIETGDGAFEDAQGFTGRCGSDE